MVEGSRHVEKDHEDNFIIFINEAEEITFNLLEGQYLYCGDVCMKTEWAHQDHCCPRGP